MPHRFIHFFHYFFSKENNQFFTSIALRSFAIGMVLIFEPIYLYSYFNSISTTLLFFAVFYGTFGVSAVYAGKLMSKIGPKHSALISHFFFFGYYLSLFLLPYSFLFIPLAVILGGMGMALFWPAFHVEFNRFSENGYTGRAVGRINVISSIPTIISPAIGGVILSLAGYPVLFTAVLAVLLISSIPMMLFKESYVFYSDSFQKVWQKIFKKENRKNSLAFAAECVEGSINSHLWPLFMFLLAIGYAAMGGIVTFAIAASTVFTLYMGRLADKIINRIEFLNIGSFLTSMSWIIKYFVVTPLDAFLAQSLYGICRATANIPFYTFFYKKVSLKGPEADEFIVYREVVINLARFLTLIFLAVIFYFTSQINLSFILAAVLSFGFMLLGIPPKFKF